MGLHGRIIGRLRDPQQSEAQQDDAERLASSHYGRANSQGGHASDHQRLASDPVGQEAKQGADHAESRAKRDEQRSGFKRHAEAACDRGQEWIDQAKLGVQKQAGRQNAREQTGLVATQRARHRLHNRVSRAQRSGPDGGSGQNA